MLIHREDVAQASVQRHWSVEALRAATGKAAEALALPAPKAKRPTAARLRIASPKNDRINFLEMG